VIKRLFRHLAEQDKPLRMFQDEARLLAELSHPNIPQVYELGQEDGTWYIAMEHVDGHDLSDLLSRGSRDAQAMPLPVALGIVVQICEALHHAHERRDKAGRPLRIVHRDVTPQNIMVTRDGVAKLLDFGIARTAARRDTDAGVVKGTFSYMAPEQVRAKPLDKRADIFALGITLYELTTGTRLFRGTDVSVMTQIVEHDAPSPRDRDPHYPEALEAVVRSTLSRDRSQRMPSAAHLGSALEDVAAHLGFSIGPRTVARHVGQVFPYEMLVDESSGIVEQPARLDIVPESEAAPLAQSLGDEGLLDDLAMLGEGLDAAHDRQHPPEALDDDALLDSVEELDGPTGETPAAAPVRPSITPSILRDPDETGPKPVVLLDHRKKKSEAPGASDYMRDLMRRLEDEEDDTEH